jgi:hypothetical protein
MNWSASRATFFPEWWRGAYGLAIAGRFDERRKLRLRLSDRDRIHAHLQRTVRNCVVIRQKGHVTTFFLRDEGRIQSVTPIFESANGDLTDVTTFCP